MSKKTTPALKDAAERQRIVTELDRSMLVEAGAGSGKTHEMAARMAAGVASGAYQIEHMVAVTFTRKAAAELRGRFQFALEELLQSRSPGSSDPGSPADVSRIQHALSNIERFFAGTIHSFCARLLRERPVEAGVSPGFGELDDVEDALLREQSWRDYRAHAKAVGDPNYLALLDSGIKSKQLDDAFRRVCLHEEVEFPPGDATMPDDGPYWTALEAFWHELSSLLPGPIDPDTTCETQRHAARFQADWELPSNKRRTPELLATLLGHWEFTPKIVQKWWSDDVAEKKRLGKEIPERHQQFKDSTVAPFLTAWRQHLYGACVEVLTAARQLAADERRRRNSLSFNDLLLRTAEVLRTNADVRQALQQKYRWLFVDEFQDTDPIQAEIMFLLAGDVAAGLQPGGSADWRTVPIRPGALFVVGDPKQSIFRFTRADIDIYNQVRDRLVGSDGLGIVTLTTNFRSVPALCDWANQVFDGPFPTEADEYTPNFAPLEAARGEDRAGSGLFTLTIPQDVDDGVGEEAAQIARRIQSEVGSERRAFGDFLVLTRRKRDLQRYAEALEALQIPVEVSGGSGFSESDEVRQLALLLLALTDPQDQVALVGVLRGALFGLSDRELFAWRQAGGWFLLFSEITDMQPVGQALERLRRWHKWTRMLPAGAALERILDDSGYLAVAAASPEGVEAGDLLHAVDRIRASVESGFTLAQAAQVLASWSKLDDDGPEESTEVESLSLRPGRSDVVRVMNLHKAKGLEAPVVFLADPSGGFEPRVDVRIVRGTEPQSAPLGFFQITAGYGWSKKPVAEPVGWDRLHDEEKAYLDAEQTRLLYVASTRARDTVVVGRWSRRRKHTAAWAELHPHLADATELDAPTNVELQESVPVDLAEASAKKAMRTAENAHGKAMRPSWSATSVTAESERLPTITTAVASEVQPDDPTRSVVDDTPSRRADAGMAWGTLIHGLLEHAMRHETTTRDDLRRLAMWLTVEEQQLRAVIDQALDTVGAVGSAEFWKEARASTEVHEEVPFSVRQIEDKSATVVSGAIDLAHRTPLGWRIIDYKTDVTESREELGSRHSQQIAAYADAWKGISGEDATTDVVVARHEPPEEPS